MFEIGIAILLGILGGVSVGFQSAMAGPMSERIGGTASSFIVHASGAIAAGLLLIGRGGEQIRNWHTLPWYMLASGVFGVTLYLTLGYTLPRLGATTVMLLIFIGQLLIGMQIDQFGLFGYAQRSIDAWKLIGALIVLLGGYLIVK